MSDDFIEQTENHWRNRGFEFSHENLVQNFQLYGPRKRAEALDLLDNNMRNTEPTMENMRRMVDLAELRQNLDTVHHTLLKVNR